jgi:hypothetical protein
MGNDQVKPKTELEKQADEKLKALKNDFELHVRCLMKRGGMTLPEARAKAYGDGIAGLNKLLGL